MRQRSGFRLLLAAGAILASLALAACGTAAGPPPGPAVTLTLSTPHDASATAARRAQVSGSVTPHRATVRVLGARVAVSRTGGFSTRVELSVGENLVDVIASLPRSVGTATAVRVDRFLLVTVPDLTGQNPAEAAGALRALGLSVRRVGSSDPLNSLLPGADTVCSLTPSPGSRVDPGTTVVLKTSKFCF